MRLSNFLSLFKLKMQTRQKILRVRLTKAITRIIATLIKLGCIKRISNPSSSKVYVWLHTNYTKSYSILVRANRNHKFIVNKRTLKKLKIHKYNSFFVLSTPRGITTSLHFERETTGGHLLVQFL